MAGTNCVGAANSAPVGASRKFGPVPEVLDCDANFYLWLCLICAKPAKIARFRRIFIKNLFGIVPFRAYNPAVAHEIWAFARAALFGLRSMAWPVSFQNNDLRHAHSRLVSRGT